MSLSVFFGISLCPAGNRVTPEGVALVMFPKTAMTLLLGRRDENVSSISAVFRRAAGDVGSISNLSFVTSVLIGLWLRLKSAWQ